MPASFKQTVLEMARDMYYSADDDTLDGSDGKTGVTISSLTRTIYFYFYYHCYDFDRFRLYSCDRIQSVSDNAQASVQGAS